MSVPALPPASFDSVVLAAVLVEAQALIGARLVRLHQVDPHTIALVLRGGPGPDRSRTLLVSIHARWGRMHLTRRPSPHAAVTPFLQQVRSRLEGAVLRSIDAPPFERIVTCGFDGLEGESDFVIEIMGRHSNLILRANGIVLGAHRLVGRERPGARDVLPHRPYLPPPRSRPDPTAIAPDDLARLAAGGQPGGTHRRGASAGEHPAWRTVLEATAGIGPAMAHEVCVRAGVNPHRALPQDAARAVTDALHAVGDAVGARQFAPILYRNAEGDAAAYAAFPMRVYETLAPHPASMSVAVEEVTECAASSGEFELVRQALSATVAQASRRVNRALEAVANDILAAEDAGRLRQHGELILAYLNRIAPGAQIIEVPGFDGRPVSIPLDPGRSAVENAQAYFHRSGRAAAARRRLPQRRAELEAEQAFLENAATAIAHADSADDLWEVEQDLIAVGLRERARRTVRPSAASAGRMFEVSGGGRIRVGRSARENDHLTFEVARPDDLWLHARGMPGAHVILSVPAGPPAEDAIETAARIAAHYSAGRGAARVPVDVTRRRFVRRVRGGRPGQVTYTHERTFTVAPGLPPGRRDTRRG